MNFKMRLPIIMAAILAASSLQLFPQMTLAQEPPGGGAGGVGAGGGGRAA